MLVMRPPGGAAWPEVTAGVKEKINLNQAKEIIDLLTESSNR
jgi:hypothetical protein